MNDDINRVKDMLVGIMDVRPVPMVQRIVVLFSIAPLATIEAARNSIQ